MKTTPRQLALLISLIISIVCAALVVMSLFLDIVHPLIMIIASAVLAFIIAFSLVYYAVNNFIFEKINPLYKSIENIHITKDELKKKLEGKDVIQEVNKMVINYAQNRAKKIKKLRKMEKYRKEFLGNVSHELKTPIFNIQGYILTLLDGGLEDPEINREYLIRTEKSVNRMVSLIEDLESITKLETGDLELEWENFDIVQLVKYVYELQDSIRARFNVGLAFDRSYDKPIMVTGDKKRITEVLNNLIMNSIFYGNKGGKTTISFAEMGENILIDVTDNGLGLEEDEIPRIFERFYRTDKSRSRDRGGTGLGLSIVKHIIEAHNQTITVRSELGAGSSFSFTLKKS
jgi:two-component system phosphate regulon sensor histidine kinase PhoR